MTQGVYLQVCEPETGVPPPAGDVGEIVVTVFNKAYPLIRFGTGDLGALSPALIDGAQNLLGLYGRSGEAIKVRGMFLHPNQLRAAQMQFPQIKHIQAIISHVDKKDYVLVNLEMQEGREAEGAAIGQQLKALAQNAIRLRVDEVNIVPAGTINAGERTVQDTRTWE
jgi:phenylacetate-CoA ligase